MEETGIDIAGSVLRPFKEGRWSAVDRGEKVGIIAVFMHVILPERPQLILSEEHDDYAWLTRRNYRTYQANHEVYEIVEELL